MREANKFRWELTSNPQPHIHAFTPWPNFTPFCPTKKNKKGFPANDQKRISHCRQLLFLVLPFFLNIN